MNRSTREFVFTLFIINLKTNSLVYLFLSKYFCLIGPTKKLYIYIYIYYNLSYAYDKFPDFFRMGIFIDEG